MQMCSDLQMLIHAGCDSISGLDTKLHQRLMGNSSLESGYNRLETYLEVYEQVGTGLLVINLLAHQALSPGTNRMGLGHWSWVQIRGWAQQHMHIISMYRPCKTNRSSTMYQQHIWALAKCNWSECLQSAVI